MKKRVLVVDDDEGILDAVQIVLESAGYDVRTAVNGRFIQELNRIVPDVILLDILLSGEDGRELCSIIKNKKETRHIPVIMSSAHASAGRVTNVYGANAFLPKPFDIDKLVETIKVYVPNGEDPS